MSGVLIYFALWYGVSQGKCFQKQAPLYEKQTPAQVFVREFYETFLYNISERLLLSFSRLNKVYFDNVDNNLTKYGIFLCNFPPPEVNVRAAIFE